ncbi:MAG: hypothetical protein GXO39_09480 [Thermotogae bacterium]|nr:hypothetical protein [Thermotogota bacterium]
MLALVVCSAPFVGEFLEDLRKEGFEGWTLIPKVLGQGGRSDPQMDNDVWPGYSSLILIYLPMDRLNDLVQLLREYDKRVVPFKAFLLKEVEEV